MNRNIITAMILAVLIISTIFIQNVSGNSAVDEHLVSLKEAIAAEKWSVASVDISRIKKEWYNRKPLLSLNNSTSHLRDFEQILAQLEAFISHQNKPSAAAQIAQLTQIWQDFGR